jgi:hypothetical protein
VSPFFSYGSPNTRFTVMASSARPMSSLTFMSRTSLSGCLRDLFCRSPGRRSDLWTEPESQDHLGMSAALDQIRDRSG